MKRGAQSCRFCKVTMTAVQAKRHGCYGWKKTEFKWPKVLVPVACRCDKWPFPHVHPGKGDWEYDG